MIDSNEWRVRIYEDPNYETFSFFMASTSPGDVRMYVSDVSGGKVTQEIKKEGDAIKPCMTLTKGMMQALFTALQGQGMKPVEQSFVEGKFEATKEHLEDMRKLVFKD